MAWPSLIRWGATFGEPARGAQARLVSDSPVSRAGVDAVGGDFDFGDAAEGEQELHEVRGRLVGGLFHNVGHGVSNRSLEHDALGLEAGQVHTHELSGLECRRHREIVPRRAVKCKLAESFCANTESNSSAAKAARKAKAFMSELKLRRLKAGRSQN